MATVPKWRLSSSFDASRNWRRGFSIVSRRLALLCELERYTPSPEEIRTHARLCTLLGELFDPFSRSCFDPGHVTAGAFVVSPDRKSVLLVHHRRYNIWIGPGGHIDPTDPRAEYSAHREVAEETGITRMASLVDGIFDIDVHQVSPSRLEPAHVHFNVSYAFIADVQELVPTAEVLDVVWQPFSEVGLLTSDRAVLRATRKLNALG